MDGRYDGPRPVEDVRSTRPLHPFAVMLKARLGAAARERRRARDDRHLRADARAVRARSRSGRRPFEPKPILWGLLWDHETSWLAFLILLLMLVFWQAGLYAPREVREGAGPRGARRLPRRGASLAFAIGTGQHFTTFGLYFVGAVFVAALIGVFRASYETITGIAAASCRRATQGDTRRRRRSAGAAARYARRQPRRHRLRIRRRSRPGGEFERALATRVARRVRRRGCGARRAAPARDRRGGAPARRQSARRAEDDRAPVERGEYVPGQGVPLFELRPPIFAGADWATKRTFDILVGALIVVVGLPVWLLIAAADQAHLARARSSLRPRASGSASSRSGCSSSARWSPARPRSRPRSRARTRRAARSSRSATIRASPAIGRFLRRFSIDEIPNVINVLRGEMSLVGPRPLPLRDYKQLEPWHRRRYNVLPGMTGLWQIAGRSDLTFDDLVRLDFYYLEHWSIWLDISILLKTPVAVFAARGAY